MIAAVEVHFEKVSVQLLKILNWKKKKGNFCDSHHHQLN